MSAFLVPQRAIQEAKEIYLSEYGMELPDSEALDFCINLLTAFNKTYRPIRKDWLQESLIQKVEENNDNNESDKAKI